jgi:DNA-binding MurR/RpiR family transcriptional regulator
MRNGGKTRGIADPFGERLHARERWLSPRAHRVARYIDQNRATALASSAAELAARLGTSDATVVRAVQTLGFAGLSDLRQALAATLQQRSTPADNMRRTLSDVGEGAGRAIDLVFGTHQRAIDALRSHETRAAITHAVSTLHQATRIVVFGIGPSAPLAHYVTFLLARNGRCARAVDATGIALADQLLDLREQDALLMLAYGRSYPEVVATFAEARRLRLAIVLITDSLETRLARRADVVIPARRGQPDRVALHGATFVVLEALVLALAASDRKFSIDTLQRLNDLRQSIGGIRANVV